MAEAKVTQTSFPLLHMALGAISMLKNQLYKLTLVDTSRYLSLNLLSPISYEGPAGEVIWLHQSWTYSRLFIPSVNH